MITPVVNNLRPQAVVVDNFLANPDEIRQFALEQQYKERHSAGLRSLTHFPFTEVYRPAFERLINVNIRPDGWDYEGTVNGCFQWCEAKTPKVIHCDNQRWAGALYLTPDAPPEAGTTLYRRKSSKARFASEHVPPDDASLFSGGFFDQTLWEPVDQIGNVYNRLVLWNGHTVHAASVYFGTKADNSRLFQVFFFD